MLKPVASASEKKLRIGQVARMLEVEPYVLRFWEEEFPQLIAARTDRGQRYYTQEHIQLLEKIRYLLYEEKMTIKGARQRLEGTPGVPSSLETIRTELKEIRQLLVKP